MSAETNRPIVCGTDFSTASRQAAFVAALLARKLGTHLFLVHGIDERGEVPAHHWEQRAAESAPRLRAEAQHLEPLGVPIRELVAGAAPDDGLARWAERADARMIVVASSGMTGMRRMMIGSISEQVAETAWVPTLVVREPVSLQAWLSDERPLNILVGSDFTPTSEAAMRWVGELASETSCEITVASIDPREKITALFGGHQIRAERLVGSPGTELEFAL